MKARWDLVIFDCDGVLVDSEPIANEVLQEVLLDLGLDLEVDEVAATFVGMTIPECLLEIEALLGTAPPADFFDGWRARLYARFEERPVTAVSGIEAVLDAVDVPTAIVSNGPMIKMQTTLGVTGLLPRFAGRIFCPDSGLPGKPRPELFLAAAAAANAEPRRTAVIEDTATGALGARAAGMTVFGYVGGRHTDAAALRAAGARLFDDMLRLPALLRGERER